VRKICFKTCSSKSRSITEDKNVLFTGGKKTEDNTSKEGQKDEEPTEGWGRQATFPLTITLEVRRGGEKRKERESKREK